MHKARLRVCLCENVPRVGDTLDDGLVSPHGYAGVLRGDDDRRGDGVRRSSHIYHTHRRQIEKREKIYKLYAELRLIPCTCLVQPIEHDAILTQRLTICHEQQQVAGVLSPNY